MLLDNPANDVKLGYECSLLVSLLSAADPQAAIQARANVLKPGVTSCIYVPPTTLQVGQAFVKWPGYAMILLQGSSLVEHGTLYIDELHNPINYSDLGGFNGYLNRMAVAIANNASFSHIEGTPRLIVAGHSMGGACAYGLALRYQFGGTIPSISCITYGAPRPGPDTFANLCGGLDLERYMNDTDPVPLVPPRQNEAPLFFAAMTQTQRTNCNRYVHTKGGVQLEIDGRPSARDVPGPASINIQFNLGAWLLSLALNFAATHSMPSYVSRLALTSGMNQDNPPPTPRTTHRGSPVESSSREDRRQADETLRLLNANVREGNNVPTVLPKSKVFTYGKVGGVWATFLDGSLVAVGPTRRAAGGLANRGNQFLRRLQTEGVVYPDALALALQAYLNAATSTTEGFSPVMRT